MLRTLKQTLARNISNIPGWRTNRKIVVIESDDWGSIRMPSRKVRDLLFAKEVPFGHYQFDRVDNLESHEDLEALFEMLSKHRDFNGNHPIITANTIMCNPDFEKIRNSDYTEYFYETFPDTLNRYYPQDQVWELWKEGTVKGFFRPQFHGREHVNVSMWMNALRKDYSKVRLAFDNGVFSSLVAEDSRKKVLHAYNVSSVEEEKFVSKSISVGLALFEDLFGYESLTAIAPSFTWDDYVEKIYSNCGVKLIQGSRGQKHSVLHLGEVSRHYTGQANSIGQHYLVRNVNLECADVSDHKSLLNRAMSEVDSAFFFRKPAIVTAHRHNFIGSLSESNRTNNLETMDSFLTALLKKYPDVEFLSSDQLIHLGW